MSEENDSLIGFDPLAWMKDEEEEGAAAPAAAQSAEPAAPAVAQETIEPVAEPKPAAEPVAAEAPAEAPAEESAPVEAAAAEAPTEAPAAAPADGVVDLGDSLDIAHVGALYEQLSGGLREGHDPALDGSQVERVDAAGLQLLCAYGRELAGHGGSIQWRGEPAAALREAAELLDLHRELGLAA